MQKHNKNRFAATALSALMAFGSLGSLPALLSVFAGAEHPASPATAAPAPAKAPIFRKSRLLNDASILIAVPFLAFGRPCTPADRIWCMLPW